MNVTEQEEIVHDGIAFRKGMTVTVNTPDGVTMDKIRGCYIDEDGEPCLALVVRSWCFCDDVISVRQ